MNIRNLSSNVEEVGGFFAKSKLVYTWKFTLDDIKREIILEHSRLKGKRRIVLDNKELCRYMKYTYNFSYSFSIDKHNVSIQQVSQGYELRIEGITFATLLNRQKLARYNVIREEFIKEHPIPPEPTPALKKSEERKEILELLSQRNQQQQQQLNQEGLQNEDDVQEETDDNNNVIDNKEEDIQNEGDVGKDEEVKQQVYAHNDRTIEDNGNHLDLLGEEFFGDDNNNNNKDNTNVNKSTNDMEKVLNIHESIHNINQNLNIGEIQKASQQQSTNLIDFS